MELRLHNLFNSIDGEYNCFLGAGQPSTFIRTWGCNLKCAWCDTRYACLGEPSIRDTEDIARTVIKMSNGKYTITGGEPLLQAPAIDHLIREICAQTAAVTPQVTPCFTIETNGSILPLVSLETIDNVRFVYDYKLPSSKMSHLVHCDMIAAARRQDAIKLVIGVPDDYAVAKELIKTRTTKAVWVFSALPELRTWVADQLVHDLTGPYPLIETQNVLYNMQLHKILWPQVIGDK